MSVTDSQNNNTFTGWGQNCNLDNNTDENAKNQWSGNMNNKLDKIFGSWAQAVSGDSSAFQSSNIPNNSNQPDINQMESEDNGSQINNNQNSNTSSSHLVFDDLIQNNLYSTKWGTSVINYDISWELSPSCAKEKTKGGSKNSDNIKNNGTELWEANLKQNKDPNFQFDSQIPKAQNAIEKKDTQWKAMAASHSVGIWGEEEDLSNVWTGTPNQNIKDDGNDNLYRQVNSINSNEKKTQVFNSNKNRISEKNWNNGEVFNYESEQKSNSDIIAASTPTMSENIDNRSLFYVPTQNPNLNNDIDKVMTDSNNVDNGTSLWGDPQGQDKVCLWKEEKSRNNNQPNNSNDSLSSSPGILRLPNSNSQNKDQWKKYQANESSFNNNTRNNWNELFVGLDRNNTNNQTPSKNGTNWSEASANTEDWNKKNKRKQLTKEFILSSSLFKVLVDMGFKEEDVENTLRNCKMNLQESIEELRLNTLKETGAQNQQPIQHLNQNSPALNNILQKNSASIPNPDNLPSEKLLAHFVQKIQLAVQNRHLSPQILNQQLAPQTITLIYELLKQVELRKNLKPYVDPRDYNAPAGSYLAKYNKCLEKITNIEKQIKLQQAIFLKQQNLSQQMVVNRPAKPNPSLKNNNDFKILTNDLGNLQLNQQQNQSRLNQWKLPNFEKNKAGFQENLPNDYFSRAPGSTKQPQQFVPVNNSWTGMNNENWQTNLINCKDNSLSSSAPQTSSFNEYNEINTGFNANKQWKNQMQINNNEIPYAINEVEDQIYDWSNKVNSVDTVTNDNMPKNSSSFDSSTWSFNSNLQTNNSEKNWMNDAFSNTTIWNNNTVNKAKGPPPGLGMIKSQKQNFWTNEEQNSSFLLLRKLSPQIDESTLKTLCIQHGPLQFFHLFLNFGIGLVKYNSKEEASKAQAALNNCLLGNTTISVSLASDSEVQQYLSHQASLMPDNSAIYRNNHNVIPSDNTNDYLMANENVNGNLNTWNSAMPNNATNLWSFNQNNSTNLWNTMDQNNCNNSLQNLLPDNLLGESS